MMNKATALLALALSAAAALPVPAARAPGTIRGKIDAERALAATQGRPNIADLGMKEVRGVRSEDRRSVVYLETAPRGAFEDRSDARARMDQRDEMFVPHVLAIMVGTTVDFTNSDRTYHNVFSLSRTRPFDLGRYPTGHSKSIRFDRAGIVRVFCDIHSHMSAFILVFGHRYFGVADEEGRFRIDSVPPGTYNVVVWNEAMAREVRRITVPDDGGEVEMNVTLGRAQP